MCVRRGLAFSLLLGLTAVAACSMPTDEGHLNPQFSIGGSCPPCDAPNSQQTSDFYEALEYVEFNNEDCDEDLAIDAIDAFFNALSTGDVAVYPDNGDWGFWRGTSPRIGLSDFHWDTFTDYEQLAATILHEGGHEVDWGQSGHALTESLESCVFW